MSKVIQKIQSSQSHLNNHFDEIKHEYTVNKKSYMSASKLNGLLSSTIGDVPSFIMKPAVTRGNNIHAITEEWDLGNLDEDEVIRHAKEHEVTTQIETYIDKTNDCVIQWDGIELMVFNEELRLAGTVDRLGLVEIEGKVYLSILDIKSGEYRTSQQTQLITYATMVKHLMGDEYDIEKLILFSVHKKNPNFNVLDTNSEEFAVAVDIVKLNMAQRYQAVKRCSLIKARGFANNLVDNMLKGLK